MPYKIYPFVRSSLGRCPPLLQARTRGENADFCNFSSRHVLQRPVVVPNARSGPPPWHAVAFPRLVNSGFVLPCDPSHLPIALTHGKPPPQSRARHFRGKIRPPRVDCDVPSGQNSAARFEISTVTNEDSRGPRLKSVSRFHSFSALPVCSDYHLPQP